MTDYNGLPNFHNFIAVKLFYKNIYQFINKNVKENNF